jgi:uncharacterized membrane protein YhaH (DUF805 family)
MNLPSMYPPGQYSHGGFPTAPLTYLQGAPVSFGEAIKQAFRNGFVYRGRASRSAYWWFIALQGIFGAIWFLVSLPLTGGKETSIGGVAGLVFGFILGIPVFYVELVTLALWVRRLHDTNRSAWWILLGLVPYLGAITLLIFTLLNGTPGPNRYQP